MTPGPNEHGERVTRKPINHLQAAADDGLQRAADQADVRGLKLHTGILLLRAQSTDPNGDSAMAITSGEEENLDLLLITAHAMLERAALVIARQLEERGLR